MRKINWFSRLFMSWNKLEAYFATDNTGTESLDAYKKLVESNERVIQEMQSKIELILKEKAKYEEESKMANASLSSEKNQNQKLREDLAKITQEIKTHREQSEVLKNEVRDQLKTIGKIEKTFFASTGNKGKGELGEQQVKTILEKSGIPRDMWMDNLTVGKTTVEFAMRSGEENKFIPIDSKVLDTEIDEDGLAIIDDKYKAKVKAAAKDINKYLDKSNTAGYGILVLQSDSIYMKLFDMYPTFFQEVFEEFNIIINSPSTFIQTARSISNLVQIYNRIKNDQLIYDDMISVLKTIANFGSNLSKVHIEFNKAMKNYTTIENKHTDLVKRLNKEGKVKEIPSIGLVEEE